MGRCYLVANEFNPNTGQETRSWKFKLERVAKGYVRVTCHSDDIKELIEGWTDIHKRLENIGESIEVVGQ